jgi:predicted MFS family arabinose efflux permease
MAARVFGPAIVTPLLLGSVLNPVNSSLIATALVPIARAFSVNVGAAAVLVAALYLSSAVAQPTMGKIADVVGPRRVFLAGLVLVGVGGLAGTMAPNLGTVLAARIVLGIGTSAGFPTAMLIIRRRVAETGTESPGGLLGAIAMAGQATVAVGLPLGGALVGLAGWRATFAINVPLALAGIVLSMVGLPPDPVRAISTSWRSVLRGLDVPGLTLFAASVTSLLICLMSLPHTGWWWYAAVPGGVLAFVWHERRAVQPFVDVRILAANKPLAVTYLRTCACFVAIYAVIYGVTQWLEDARGLSATQAGATMAPMSAIAVLAGVPIARRGLIRFPLLAGALIAVAVSALLGVVTSGVAIPLLIALTVMFGVNIGFSTVGNQAAMYAQAVHDDLGLASGLSRTSSNVGAILASTVVGLSYRAHGVTDTGLHVIAMILLGISVVIAMAVAADRGLGAPAPALTDRPVG